MAETIPGKQVAQYKVISDREEFYNKVFGFLSVIMKDSYLTPKEIKLISKICVLENATVTGPDRKRIAEEMGITILDFNNYLKRLRDKHVMDGDVLSVHFRNVLLKEDTSKFLFSVVLEIQ